MTIHKLTTAASTLVFLAAFAAGGGYLARSIARGDEPRKAPAVVQAPAAPGPLTPIRSRPRAGCSSSAACSTRKASRCRTRRSASRCARKLLFASLGSEGGFPAPTGQGASDDVGPVPVRCGPQPSSAHHAEFGAVAIAPGYGVGWAELDPDEDQPIAEIPLMPEQVIEGRLFDVQGQPAPGVVVSVSAIWRTLPEPPLVTRRVGSSRTTGRTRPLVGPRQRRAGLAEAGDDRRRRPLHPARHRPRPARQAERPRPAVRPADDRGRHRRPRGRRRP